MNYDNVALAFVDVPIFFFVARTKKKPALGRAKAKRKSKNYDYSQ